MSDDATPDPTPPNPWRLTDGKREIMIYHWPDTSIVQPCDYYGRPVAETSAEIAGLVIPRSLAATIWGATLLER
jgi:hypothetical protein